MSNRDEARQFLIRVLAEGPVRTERVMELAKVEGIQKRDIQELRKQGKLFTTIPNSVDGHWYWKLKEDFLDGLAEHNKK